MIAAAALPIAQSLYGIFQTIKANQELKKLGKEDISYKGTPDSKYLLGLSRDNIQHGYSAAEKAAFLQTVAGNTAKAYRLGMGRAGNSLSSVIGASNDIANSNAMNQFAASDAQQRRANQGIYAGQVAQDQSRENQNTAMQFQQNQRGQMAWGQAMQQGINNVGAGLQMGSMLMGGQDSGTPDNEGYNVTEVGDMNMQMPIDPYGRPQMNPNPMQYGLPYNNKGYQLPADNVLPRVFRNNYRGLNYNNNIQMNPQNKSYGGIDWNNLPPLYK